ncbi:hypothetical protein M569_08741 [Genlisea aurea]|uniref:Uncharacterized protein n=1 Tax=Genlisea aurea TaxID=192259 RepID=S8CMM0_9LAMI|nr:hypothetical protein M569_08741 [Genlisea aurea]
MGLMWPWRGTGTHTAWCRRPASMAAAGLLSDRFLLIISAHHYLPGDENFTPTRKTERNRTADGEIYEQLKSREAVIGTK